jgi:hypothetical protein
LPIRQFAPVLERTAGRVFDPATISRLETNQQPPSLLDLIAYAMVDPKARGLEWIAFGEKREDVAVQAPGRFHPAYQLNAIFGNRLLSVASLDDARADLLGMLRFVVSSDIFYRLAPRPDIRIQMLGAMEALLVHVKNDIERLHTRWALLTYSRDLATRLEAILENIEIGSPFYSLLPQLNIVFLDERAGELPERQRLLTAYFVDRGVQEPTDLIARLDRLDEQEQRRLIVHIAVAWLKWNADLLAAHGIKIPEPEQARFVREVGRQIEKVLTYPELTRYATQLLSILGRVVSEILASGKYRSGMSDTPKLVRESMGIGASASTEGTSESADFAYPAAFLENLKTLGLEVPGSQTKHVAGSLSQIREQITNFMTVTHLYLKSISNPVPLSTDDVRQARIFSAGFRSELDSIRNKDAMRSYLLDFAGYWMEGVDRMYSEGSMPLMMPPALPAAADVSDESEEERAATPDTGRARVRRAR